MPKKVVAHYADGTLLKGVTSDLNPNRETFTIVDPASHESSQVCFSDLKAVFFVKTFEGRVGYRDRYDLERPGHGKKIKVCFKDGETIVGYTSTYAPKRKVFFIFHPDPESNNDRILVVKEATEKVEYL